MNISYYNEQDIALRNALSFESICKNIDMEDLPLIPGTQTFPLVYPDDQYKFLHEAAVIVYHGTIFCSWYNNQLRELSGFTPIRSYHSKDGGKTWSKHDIPFSRSQIYSGTPKNGRHFLIGNQCDLAEPFDFFGTHL